MDSVHFSNDVEVFRRAEKLFDATEPLLQKLVPWAEVHHVGSTAVPGSLTKGDLDIAVRVPADRFKESDKLLSASFQRNPESEKNSGFSAFEDASKDPHLGIQLVAIGSVLDTFHSWASKLRADDRLRTEYEQLKRQHEGMSMTVYRAAKSDFIEANIGR